MDFWAEHGECDEVNIKDRLINYDEYDYYIAFQVDCFLAGTKEMGKLIERVNLKQLLEIRLFSEKGEFLARRTRLGSVFQWRKASEEGIKKKPSEENVNERNFLERFQLLDMQSEKTEEGEYGNRILTSSSGNRYELPIADGMNGIKVISYIAYDKDDGMAYVYDNRLAGFARVEGEY